MPYVYKDGDTKHPYEWKPCQGCGNNALMLVHGKGFCSPSCSKRGKNHPAWKSDAAQLTYMPQHTRVYRERGKASVCIFGCQGRKRYEWANLTGNYADTADYAQMCTSCHRRFDYAVKGML